VDAEVQAALHVALHGMKIPDLFRHRGEVLLGVEIKARFFRIIALKTSSIGNNWFEVLLLFPKTQNRKGGQRRGGSPGRCS